MASDFKHYFSYEKISQLSQGISAVYPDFNSKQFINLAAHNLADLAFKARSDNIVIALKATLPADFNHAAEIIHRATSHKAKEKKSFKSGSLCH